jgi:hypothetical protein
MLLFGPGVLSMSGRAGSQERALTLDEVRALMRQAEARGLVRKARKTKLVDARPARPGEVIETVIAGEGKETRSWQEHRPRGKVVRFFVVQEEHGKFHFEAPWGDLMRARPGDAIVAGPRGSAGHVSRRRRGVRLHVRRARLTARCPRP